MSARPYDEFGLRHGQVVAARTRSFLFFQRLLLFRNLHLAVRPGPPGATKFPGNFLVNPNCASPQGDSILVPFPRGAAVVAFARGNPADTVGVDCADIHNISPAELVNLDTTVAAYNAFIASRATARGYAYVDPNALFAVLPAGAIPDFPNLPPLATAFTTPFGTYFTFDGIHPSNATHHLIAQVLVQTINATYGSAIPLAGVP